MDERKAPYHPMEAFTSPSVLLSRRIHEIFTKKEQDAILHDWHIEGLLYCKHRHDAYKTCQENSPFPNKSWLSLIDFTCSKKLREYHSCLNNFFNVEDGNAIMVEYMKQAEPRERLFQHKIETDPEVYRSRYPDLADVEVYAFPKHELDNPKGIGIGVDHPYGMWNETTRFTKRGSQTAPGQEPVQHADVPDAKLRRWPEDLNVMRTDEEWDEEVRKRPKDFEGWTKMPDYLDKEIDAMLGIDTDDMRKVVEKMKEQEREKQKTKRWF